jgi:DNA-binding CsgD family transcriptional regulator
VNTLWQGGLTVPGQRVNAWVGDHSRWANRLASAIDQCGDANYAPLLLDVIARIAPFDLAMIVVYSGRAKPVLLHDAFFDDAAQRGLSNYINNTYILNPLHTAYCRGLDSGVYRITDLMSNHSFGGTGNENLKISQTRNEEIGYITEGWPCGMQEVTLVVELPAGELGEVSLLRAARGGGFSDSDILKLKSIEPILGATFRRHWASWKKRRLAEDPVVSADLMINRIASDLLSARERQVAELILSGCSGHAIGTQLGISITTVKTHRKNLYTKLGVATQYELFSLVLKQLLSQST